MPPKTVFTFDSPAVVNNPFSIIKDELITSPTTIPGLDLFEAPSTTTPGTHPKKIFSQKKRSRIPTSIMASSEECDWYKDDYADAVTVGSAAETTTLPIGINKNCTPFSSTKIAALVKFESSESDFDCQPQEALVAPASRKVLKCTSRLKVANATHPTIPDSPFQNASKIPKPLIVANSISSPTIPARIFTTTPAQQTQQFSSSTTSLPFISNKPLLRAEDGSTAVRISPELKARRAFSIARLSIIGILDKLLIVPDKGSIMFLVGSHIYRAVTDGASREDLLIEVERLIEARKGRREDYTKEKSTGHRVCESSVSNPVFRKLLQDLLYPSQKNGNTALRKEANIYIPPVPVSFHPGATASACQTESQLPKDDELKVDVSLTKEPGENLREISNTEQAIADVGPPLKLNRFEDNFAQVNNAKQVIVDITFAPFTPEEPGESLIKVNNLEKATANATSIPATLGESIDNSVIDTSFKEAIFDTRAYITSTTVIPERSPPSLVMFNEVGQATVDVASISLTPEGHGESISTVNCIGQATVNAPFVPLTMGKPSEDPPKVSNADRVIFNSGLSLTLVETGDSLVKINDTEEAIIGVKDNTTPEEPDENATKVNDVEGVGPPSGTLITRCEAISMCIGETAMLEEICEDLVEYTHLTPHSMDLSTPPIMSFGKVNLELAEEHEPISSANNGVGDVGFRVEMRGVWTQNGLLAGIEETSECELGTQRLKEEDAVVDTSVASSAASENLGGYKDHNDRFLDENHLRKLTKAEEQPSGVGRLAAVLRIRMKVEDAKKGDTLANGHTEIKENLEAHDFNNPETVAEVGHNDDNGSIDTVQLGDVRVLAVGNLGVLGGEMVGGEEERVVNRHISCSESPEIEQHQTQTILELASKILNPQVAAAWDGDMDECDPTDAQESLPAEQIPMVGAVLESTRNTGKHPSWMLMLLIATLGFLLWSHFGITTGATAAPYLNLLPSFAGFEEVMPTEILIFRMILGFLDPYLKIRHIVALFLALWIHQWVTCAKSGLVTSLFDALRLATAVIGYALLAIRAIWGTTMRWRTTIAVVESGCRPCERVALSGDVFNDGEIMGVEFGDIFWKEYRRDWKSEILIPEGIRKVTIQLPVSIVQGICPRYVLGIGGGEEVAPTICGANAKAFGLVFLRLFFWVAGNRQRLRRTV